MPNTSIQSGDMQFSLASTQHALVKLYEKFFETTRTQLDRNYRVLSEIGEIARANGETAIGVTYAAAEGCAVLAKSAVQLSEHSIDNGLAFSRTILNAGTAQNLVEAEEDIAQSLYESVNTPIFRFGEMLMDTTSEMMDTLLTSAKAVPAQMREAAAETTSRVEAARPH